MTKPPFEQFFAHRRLYPVAELTPDGERVLFVSNISGQFNLWSAELDGGWPEQLTTFVDNSVRGVAVREDGTILFHADRDGDEFHQLYRIPAEGGWPEQLTDLPQVQHELSPASWAPDGKSFAFSGNRRTPTDGEVYIWREGEAEPRYLFGEGMYTFAVSFSPDGSKLLAVEFRSNTDISIWVVDVASGDAVEATPHEGDAKFLPGPWKADGSGFYLLTDEGREFSGLLRSTRSPRTRASGSRRPTTTSTSSPARRTGGCSRGWRTSTAGGSVHVRDLERGADLPEPKLPPGAASMLGSGLSLSRDGSRLALVWDQPTPPGGGVRRRHRDRRRAACDGDARGGPVGARSARARAHPLRELRRPADPGVAVQAGGGGPSPFAVLIHGGPEAQERPIYRPYVQYLLSRGIGVLATNVRGSTGYGKTYQKLIHHDWGGGDLEDWRHAAEWLKAQPFVDGDRLAVLGGSYGGFATLTCVTRLPEYWRAAVDIVGPSNLVTFVRAVPPQWLRFMAEWVGDPDTEEEFLRERSPITYVDQVQAALLVLQGAKDPRVVKSESDQMVERLRELGREVEYVVFDDEGHGFTRYANEVHAYRLTCEWLESHLR